MQIHQKNTPLIKATIGSIAVAVIVSLLFILPAEYNIDPTGVGEKLGLTVFNEQVTPNSTKQSEDTQDFVVLTVPAGKGIEYKLSMKQYQKATYEWVTDEGELYVDLHGEPIGDDTGYFESFAIATVNEMKGSLSAPFEGSHGWYWKNTSDKDIQVQLIFSGDYVIEGLK
ncbi:hypothetical protein EYS14_06745 [Alteromonadaceae bacterium M269]|nr:hypothetical protein EYS14_06745 [Alteromonadaceae bacterium M269]